MRFTVLGSSGTYPTPGNPTSSYLIEEAGLAIWCDAGFGSFQALTSIIEPSELAGIFVSHRHPDHCVDLLAAFHALTYRPHPVRGMPLFANRSVIDHILAFLDADDEHVINTTFDICVVEPGDRWTVGDLDITAVGMDHSVPTLGVGFEGAGRRVFYTADTGPEGAWVSQVGPVDLLVSEASLGTDVGDMYRQHLSAGQAGSIASRVGATRLLLTHIPPHIAPLESVREAEITYGRTVMAAVPGATHEV